jgi:hypothetical protein
VTLAPALSICIQIHVSSSYLTDSREFRNAVRVAHRAHQRTLTYKGFVFYFEVNEANEPYGPYAELHDPECVLSDMFSSELTVIYVTLTTIIPNDLPVARGQYDGIELGFDNGYCLVSADPAQSGHYNVSVAGNTLDSVIALYRMVMGGIAPTTPSEDA